jgi:hypothetical protein
MKAIVIACITVAVIATVGSFVLAGVQVSAEKGFTDTISVRV